MTILAPMLIDVPLPPSREQLAPVRPRDRRHMPPVRLLVEWWRHGATGGSYVLYNEFAQGGQTVLDRREIIVGTPSALAASLAPDVAPKTVGGVTVALDAPQMIQAGADTHLTFALTEGGQPVRDLVPYLGAAAHIAIASADTTDFAHTHGVAAGDAAGGGHGGNGSGNGMSAGAATENHAVPATFGPQVGVDYTFDRPGLYRVWAQFSHAGEVSTVPLTVQVQ